MKLQTLQLVQIFIECRISWSVARRCTYQSVHFFVSRSRSVARRVRVQAFVCVVCVCNVCVLVCVVVVMCACNVVCVLCVICVVCVNVCGMGVLCFDVVVC